MKANLWPSLTIYIKQPRVTSWGLPGSLQGVMPCHLGQLDARCVVERAGELMQEASKPVSVVLSHFPPSREWESL